MRLGSIRAGDLVQCDIKGRRFHAEVTAREDTGLAIRPLQHAITYRHVQSQQVIAHWRKAGQRNRQPAVAAGDPQTKEGTQS